MSSCPRVMEPRRVCRGHSAMFFLTNIARSNATRVFALCCLLLPLAAAHAAPRHYEIDPVHTRIMFAVDHLGFSRSMGMFSAPTGSLWFDPDDWSSARLDVDIDIATLDLGDATWRTRMLKRDYFDIRRFTHARFVSHRVEATSDTTAQVHGDLTLRGVTAPVTLLVTLNKIGRNPLTFRNTAGFSATASLQRSAFGMTDNLRTVGDTVEVRIEAEAQRRRADGNNSDDESAPETEHNPAQSTPAAGNSDIPASSTSMPSTSASSIPTSAAKPAHPSDSAFNTP